MNHQKVRISTDSLQGVELYVQFPMREPSSNQKRGGSDRIRPHLIDLFLSIGVYYKT